MLRNIWIFLLTLSVAILTAAPAPCASFANKDTAKDRQDNVFGTRPQEGNATILMGTDPQSGDQTMDTIPNKPEERDWYQNMFMYIDVQPQVDVPGSKPTPTPTPGPIPKPNPMPLTDPVP